MSSINASDQNPSKCHLLGLPGELREIICGFALTSDEGVSVNRNKCLEPSLLRTCCTIKREATQIYYRTNTFILNAHDFESHTVVNFHYFASRYLKNDNNVLFDLGHQPRNWRKLEAWLKSYWKRRAFRLRRGKEDDLNEFLASKPFDIVDEMQDLEWGRIRKVLLVYVDATQQTLKKIP